MKATTEDWDYVDGRAAEGSRYARCVQELRARVEALEAQAACEPAQAEQEQGAEPLRRRMNSAWMADDCEGMVEAWASVMDVVADWLEELCYDSSPTMLREEAQATRDGRRG